MSAAESRIREHTYEANVRWTGALAGTTHTYDAYSRDHEIGIGVKTTLALSADPLFRGDASKHNPEELLVASPCHMLAYLALCARERIAVVSYLDRAVGTMAERGGAGRFIEVVLHPLVAIDGDRFDRAVACTSSRTTSASSRTPSIFR